MDWLLYTLIFIFGYVTCKTFYFLRSARISLTLIKVSQLISLGVLARSMESIHYAGTYKMQHLQKTGFSDNKIKIFKSQHEGEVEDYKRRSIDNIINCHSSTFRDMIEFNDWNSAMMYLEKNKDLIDEFFINKRAPND